MKMVFISIDGIGAVEIQYWPTTVIETYYLNHII